MSATDKLCTAGNSGWHRKVAVIAIAFSLGTGFCGTALAADKTAPAPMGSMEMHKSMMSGMKSMESMKGSGDIDHDFAMMMKMHHQSALDMANLQLQRGKDATLRGMAKDIIKSQKKEIKAFDKWLAKNAKPMNMPMSKSK